MSHWFYANLSNGNGVPLPDLECSLDCTIGDADGTAEPFLIVEAVSLGGVPLEMPLRRNIHLNTYWQSIAAEIIKQAEADSGLFERVLHDSGISHVGSPNDPSGYWQQAAE